MHYWSFLFDDYWCFLIDAWWLFSPDANITVNFVIDSIANKRQLKKITEIDPVSKVAPKIIPVCSMQGEVVAEILSVE